MENVSAEATLTPAEQKEAVILNQEDGLPEAKERPTDQKPFFEEEVSEAELMGEEAPPEEEAKEKPKDEEVATESGKPEEKPQEKPEEKPETGKDEKPPTGYVPKGALAEEREKRKEAQQEIERLRKELEGKKEEIPAEREKELLKSLGIPEDFKVLSEDEEDALMEEDLFSYNKYQRNLRKYERATVDVAQRQRIEKDLVAKSDQIVSGAVRRMEEAVPGIHEENSEINKNLTEFAVSHGFDAEYLNALTDPKTMFLPAGATSPMYLGDGAAAVVEFIHGLYRSSSDNKSQEKLEKEVTERLTKEITERVTADLMKKFKTSGKETFKSLGEAPGSMDVSTGKFTEKEFSKMTEDEQRAALGG